jgi:DNA-binding transcriptional MocR family regulator
MAQAARRMQVMEDIRRRISSRALAPGDKLPSIRAAAARLGVSPSTVAEAYDHLAAAGEIRARRGSGFFVADRPQPFTVAETGPQLAREVDPLWVARQSIDSQDGAPKPGCGWLPPDWMPHAAIRKAMRSLAASDSALLTGYGDAKGGAGLRRHIAQQLFDQGLAADPGQILLTGSGSQALDLVCRLLLRPGSTVLVDDPCYFNFLALARAHQARIVSVPYTASGPDLAAFEAALREFRPQLYLTNSALHNPTGATLAAPVAHRLLALAAAHDLTILEDDIFAEFEPAPAPRLATLDGLERVVRTGSFSKTLSASLRCGYIAAPPAWSEALADLQVATNFGGPSPLAASLLHRALTDGSYRKHITALRSRLTRARQDAAGKLSDLNITPWLEPRGGFYLWCALPPGTDAAKLARAALQEGMVLAPGNVFSASQTAASFMRFNVSQMQEGFRYDTLARLLAEQAE